MDISERAKIFLPFAALKGYEEALRAREKIVVDRAELSEERKAELDEVMQELGKGDLVRVVHFFRDEYLMKQGIVTRLDTDARILTVVNDKISFEDIYELELVEKLKI